MKYRFLPHTADIRMKIEAESLPLLFSAGIKGMSQILKIDGCQGNHYEIQRVITINSSDLTCLLIDFLSDVLTYCYTDNAVFCEVNFQKLSKEILVAEVSGTSVDVFDEEIKAVTYHEADVIQNNTGLWESMVVFDI